MSTSTVYKTLAEPVDIRLLRLQPGDIGSSIFIELDHVSLTDKPIYEALSYTWDLDDQPEVATYSVNLSGASYSVAANLFDALNRPRKKDECRILWIDAICINQNDYMEKGWQVQMMDRVYSAASRVIVWLGGEEPDTNLAFGLLQRYHDRMND